MTMTGTIMIGIVVLWGIWICVSRKYTHPIRKAFIVLLVMVALAIWVMAKYIKYMA